MENLKEKSCGIIPVFRNENGELLFLIIQHAKSGVWSFPKGHTEGTETEIETAKRELLEETGIENIKLVGDLRYIETFETRKNNRPVDKTVVLFLGFVSDQKITLQAKEVQHSKWATYTEAIDTFTYENPKRILTEAVEDLRKLGLL